MKLDRIALILIVAGGAVYCGILVLGMIALFPFGLIGLGIFAIFAAIFFTVVRQRLSNAEDDYYERNVDK
ncbi:MAG: hypothetical protein KDJ36_08515 [Hyphomicrobiaceae bacterium]|nr:hypothetical protein [Hyphomicrobiaceae bacterium]